MTAPAHPESGFTLVEALVSLLIFSLIASGGVLLLSLTLQTQSRVEAAQNELRAIQSIRAILASDLAQITPRAVREQGKQPFIFQGIGGAKPAMMFVRAAGRPGIAGQAPTQLAAVEYHIADDGSLVRLTREAIDPGPNAMERTRTLVVAAGATQFQFNDGTGWRDDWPSSFAIPTAVAITLTLPRYGQVRVQALTGL